jgi:hypothetical protein
MSEETIIIPVEVKKQELWEAVFGSAWETFGNHWYSYTFIGDASWDVIGKVKLVAIDEDTLLKTEKVVGIEELALALPKANEKVYMDLFDFDNYDAICGDAVLQMAVLDDVVYG